MHNNSSLIALFPLHFTLLININDEAIAPIIAFNAAVWRYRKPAQASRLEQSDDWLTNRISEFASTTLATIKPKARKRKKAADIESESVAHNERVSSMNTDTVICYSDGSASPNPGPCGAGVSIFLCEPDTVFDYGVSLGRGTNNFAELYGLGIIFSRLFALSLSRPTIKRAVVFCDSKLALRAATSLKNPISNGPIVRAVRAAYITAVRTVEIDLQWIRGHVQYGGNERVDRISKAFAQVDNNVFNCSLLPSFPAQLRKNSWEPGFPLNTLPIGVFLRNLPVPVRIMEVQADVLDISDVANVRPDSIVQRTLNSGHTARNRNILHESPSPSSIASGPIIHADDAGNFNLSVDRKMGTESKAQFVSELKARKLSKPVIFPTRRSARLNTATNQ